MSSRRDASSSRSHVPAGYHGDFRVGPRRFAPSFFYFSIFFTRSRTDIPARARATYPVAQPYFLHGVPSAGMPLFYFGRRPEDGGGARWKGTNGRHLHYGRCTCYRHARKTRARTIKLRTYAASSPSLRTCFGFFFSVPFAVADLLFFTRGLGFGR